MPCGTLTPNTRWPTTGPAATVTTFWQNRFFSCPLDESHLMSALRYTDLNPVRAGLAHLPWDWPWSSARVHATEDACDPVLDPDWAEYCGQWDYRDWRETLLAVVAHGQHVGTGRSARVDRKSKR